MIHNNLSSQRKHSLGFVVFLGLLLILIAQLDFSLSITLGLGLAIGFTLQKSRFCFVSAFRDPILTGMTELSRAVIILLALSIIGFALVEWWFRAQQIFFKPYVFPLGVHTLVGGSLFGIGMVIAGGCVTGVLMRIGEGFAMQMVAFIGLLLGAFTGKQTQYIWKNFFGEWNSVFLPDFLGWFPTLALELTLLFFLWKMLKWWQVRQLNK